MTAAITLEGVERHYQTPGGVVHAVNGVDLEINPGACVAIIGPSGCGKSTLLSLIGGLETPSAGKITVLGQDIHALGAEERASWRSQNVGFIFQAYDLLPFLTAVENVALQAGISRRENGAAPRELLQRLGLAGHEDKLPDQLSGGQKQRVGIARSLIHQPKLLLADEPTGGLDTETSKLVVEMILSSAREIGATTVVVTHDPGVAARLDFVIELHDGKVVSHV